MIKCLKSYLKVWWNKWNNCEMSKKKTRSFHVTLKHWCSDSLSGLRTFIFPLQFNLGLNYLSPTLPFVYFSGMDCGFAITRWWIRMVERPLSHQPPLNILSLRQSGMRPSQTQGLHANSFLSSVHTIVFPSAGGNCTVHQSTSQRGLGCEQQPSLHWLRLVIP